jgi:exopolysaccharide biosynthesis polyprenyl glycosylphosphotransferase
MGGSVRMFDIAAATSRSERRTARRLSSWTKIYLRDAALADFGCAVVGVFIAAQIRFGETVTPGYLALSLILPVVWVGALWLAGAYDVRFIGTGSDEYRKVLNAGVGLTAAVALFSYAVNLQVSRAYVVIALPSVTLFDSIARFMLRKRLHKLRAAGRCMHNVVAVGHELAVADLIAELRREPYHGLAVVGACLAHPGECDDLAGIPVYGGLDDITAAVKAFEADTVAVLACPEMNGIRLRSLAWELEKTSTDLCVAPSLLDVAGPRTTIRPTAGLTLLHVDHPQLGGMRLVFKELFDRCAAAAALVMLAPLMAALSLMIRLHDRGPALFTQTRVGKDGRPFKMYKFRTMVVDAEQRKEGLLAQNEFDGVLFKLRKDPRVTAIGTYLRRWSLDELPQLYNVFLGHMSLVGPRPPLPDEAEKYAAHVRRRLVVKPGITGLWQVNGRSNLSWEESVRLDLRYVENWSFTLDLQILWKTISAMTRGSGAY